MPLQQPKISLILAFLFLLLAGNTCSPSIDTLLKRAKAASKNASPKMVDTTIVVLPGLLLFKEDARAHNATSYDIICLDKRGIVTDNLAEIERCECRLYQQEGEKVKRMRVLWSAEPLDDWTWSRTYFDENSKPKTKDRLKVTDPYKYIFVNEETTWGGSVTHVVVTMYFEMKVIWLPGSRI